MVPHELLTVHQAKALEYLLAVAFLVLFVPFWRFVNGGARVARAVPARRAVRRGGWFGIPDGVLLHPGHTWVRDGATLTVGLDDFARKLVGPLAGIELPHAGAVVRQGEPAFRLRADGRAVDVTAPIDGTVVTPNQRALDRPEVVSEDPYGAGWLVKVRPLRPRANLNQLLSGGPARKWLDGVAESLMARATPELGAVLQDGGQPVHGIARELEPDTWDLLARKYLLTD